MSQYYIFLLVSSGALVAGHHVTVRCPCCLCRHAVVPFYHQKTSFWEGALPSKCNADIDTIALRPKSAVREGWPRHDWKVSHFWIKKNWEKWLDLIFGRWWKFCLIVKMQAERKQCWTTCHYHYLKADCQTMSKRRPNWSGGGRSQPRNDDRNDIGHWQKIEHMKQLAMV